MIENTCQYHEHYFLGNPNFGKQTVAIIYKNWDENYDMVNQIVLKIVLPKLPECVKYKTNCIYDLLKSIELEIGRHIFLNYTSDQLKKLDIIKRGNGPKSKLLDRMGQNNQPQPSHWDSNGFVIFYPINITDIFGQSKIKIEKNDQNSKQISDCQLRGIKISELHFSDVRFKIELAELSDIVENQTDDHFDIQKQLKELSILDCCILVRYQKTKPKTYIGTKSVTEQKIALWKIDQQTCSVNNKPYQIKIPMDWYSGIYIGKQCFIRRLIFQCNHSDKLTNYLWQINGYDLSNVREKILDQNKHITNIDSLQLTYGQNITLDLKFNGPVDQLIIDAFFEIETKCTYGNGIILDS